MDNKYKPSLLKHIHYMAEILHDKMNSKTLGKKFGGEVVFKINVHDGGITNNDCEIKEKIKNK